MMAMTTSNSMSVKPAGSPGERLRLLFINEFGWVIHFRRRALME
jgi:hypothetical protein